MQQKTMITLCVLLGSWFVAPVVRAHDESVITPNVRPYQSGPAIGSSLAGDTTMAWMQDWGVVGQEYYGYILTPAGEPYLTAAGTTWNSNGIPNRRVPISPRVAVNTGDHS